MIDLTPACDATAALVESLRDDELALATPCDDLDVAGVVAHLDEAGQGFTTIARGTGEAPAAPFGADRPPGGPWSLLRSGGPDPPSDHGRTAP